MHRRADYDRLAATYDDVRGEPPFLDAWTRRIARELDLGPGARLLDVGCGTGAYATPLARLGANVVGLDLSRGMLAKARAKGGGLDLVRGTGPRLPFAASAFDAAIAVFVLHHVPEWPRLLAECARVLRPGGGVAVLTRSHAQLRDSVMAKFPGVLDVDLQRFPDAPEVEAVLRRDVGEVATHALTKGPNAVPVEEWVRRAQSDFISTLSLLPDEQRREGLAEFERRLRAHGPRVDDRSAFSLLVARKA